MHILKITWTYDEIKIAVPNVDFNGILEQHSDYPCFLFVASMITIKANKTRDCNNGFITLV
jgi:hypothetical protein